MAVVNKGNGVTYTYSGITLAPISMEVPGFDRDEIDLTNLNNVEHMTSTLGTLKKASTFTLVTEFDPALIDLPTAASATFAIVFPNSGGTITIYVELKGHDNITIENGTRPVLSMTFQVTNLNGTTETGPAYSA